MCARGRDIHASSLAVALGGQMLSHVKGESGRRTLKHRRYKIAHTLTSAARDILHSHNLAAVMSSAVLRSLVFTCESAIPFKVQLSVY